MSMYEEESRVCNICDGAYAAKGIDACNKCAVEDYLARQEADEAAARHHYGESPEELK